MRSVKKVHKSEYRPISDLETYSPLPTRSLSQIDPFLFLNHHGPQFYGMNNHGLPFGPHPHRGMETVTFILEGDIVHKDSEGHASIIHAGGIQYMTAGKGVIHEEVSSPDFKRKGGPLEILQLWINLPARLKMIEPQYVGFQKNEIPKQTRDNGKVIIESIAGHFDNFKGAFTGSTDFNLSLIHIIKDAELIFKVPENRNIFFYIIRGDLFVNKKEARGLELVEFLNDNENIVIKAMKDSLILYGDAIPFKEPVVAQGPFVMNTEEEILQAYEDYKKGKFGTWK